MRVALVHDWLVNMRGGEKCLEVFSELYPGADLYTLIYCPDQVSGTLQRMNVKTSWINRLPGIGRYYRYFLPAFPKLIEGFELEDYDLVLSSSHCVAKGVFPKGAFHISYIYSPMRYVWDMHDLYFGSNARWITRKGMARFREPLQKWDVAATDRVHRLASVSRHIAAKIKRYYGRESTVIYPPVNVHRFQITPRQEQFYLVVSALVPSKRIDIAVDAFNGLKLRLKIIGEGPLKRALEQRARPNIEFLGWIEDAKLPEYYTSCQAVVVPGEEDFGIVPLEAQASGRPVIAYGRGGVLETVVSADSSDKSAVPKSVPTGIFFRDPNAGSLMGAVENFEQTKGDFDSNGIRCHAAQFSREAFKLRMQQFINDGLNDWGA